MECSAESQPSFRAADPASALPCPAASFVEGGGRVLISDVNEAAGAGLAGALGPSAVFARTDCTSESEVEQARQSPRSMARRGRWRMLRQRARSWA